MKNIDDAVYIFSIFFCYPFFEIFCVPKRVQHLKLCTLLFSLSKEYFLWNGILQNVSKVY